MADFPKHIDMMPEAEGHRLKGRSPQMSAAMVEPQADERATRQRIVDRRLLTKKVG